MAHAVRGVNEPILSEPMLAWVRFEIQMSQLEFGSLKFDYSK